MTASRLSSTVQRLIKNAHYDPLPGPSAAIFHEQFSRISREAHQKQFGENAWLALTAAALVTLNSPNGLKHLWTYLKSHQTDGTRGRPSEDEQIRRAALMREAGLKSISFIGIAKVINNLGAMHSAFDDAVKARLPEHPTRQPTRQNIDAITARSKEIWRKVYRPYDAKLIEKLGQYHPDLPVHILNSHYGALLSDPVDQPSPIGRVLVSLVAIGCLRGTGGVGPQLTSHVFGLKKAGEEGDIDPVTSEGLGTNWKALTEDEGAEWAIRVVDALADVVAQPGGRESKL
ncbi:uncharacterized protein L969DRAFT_96252 [Mixia osmundae IAM 14324]|uniref:Dol-P-Man:Man(5)GlcNAc(2)-PP-Dol alpha-1,3-mannosyltransferase n=1 Tax=Mixia osmundae (strain CBS 9802 / IAM 14324 / JCM 22182 / KY 12970) TaxID=764103 RepID=G7E4W1_MIXOS|nr:uncharacterized protein L969DRAFT_96252 [Mixia osmundae IAM 14324]KEI37734.1 hypothetical protein L969DRAFT_96252 [Mixia osmundae IAM 14324]GAA97871.1 hypothetical protein E5Q_04551 [Mixia osmundae IAM 14324]